MEVWENVNPESGLERMDYGALKTRFEEDEFSKQMAEYSTSAAKLFLEEGIMLDMADDRGIHTLTSTGYKAVRTLDETFSFLEEESDAIPYPRNMTYSNNRLMFYDVYPVTRVNRNRMSRSDQVRMLEAVHKKDVDIDALRTMVVDGESLNTLRYVVLLSKLGADFESL